ncbi:NAD-dependent protein deacetylase [soil metagenome]
MIPEGLIHAAEILQSAQRVVVSTGAGMSRESGIPTFRDAQEGLWARFNPEELATERGFRTAPARVWGWYAHRRRAIMSCEPHPGHGALVALERLLPELVVVTQNIDGLHQASGSADVIELHGSIRRSKCLDHGHPFASAFDEEIAGGEDAEQDPPPCPDCGSPLRPDVVWFGEMLPAAATTRAREFAEQCDVMLVVGTSGMVWPAAELPFVAERSGACIIEINPDPSEITRIADVFLQGRAGEVLPALVQALNVLRH